MSAYRKYLLNSAIFFIPWGLTLIFSSWLHTSVNWYDFPAYSVVDDILPMGWWGVVTLVLGVAFAGLTHVAKKAEYKTRAMIVVPSIAACVTTIWMVALTITLLSGDNSPLGPLLFLFITGTHSISATLPVREQGPIEIPELVLPEESQ